MSRKNEVNELKNHSFFNNRIIQNASWIIVSKIIQSVLILIVGMLTARYLGPSDYGLVNYASSIASFAVPIAQLGLNNIMVQELVSDPKREGTVMGTALLMSSVSALLCMVGVAAFVFFANVNETKTLIVCVLYSIVLLFQSMEMIQYWYQAKYLSKYTSIVSLAAYIVVSVYKIFLLATNKSVYWFAVSNAIDYMLISVVLLYLYKRLGGQKLIFSLADARRMLKKSRPYIFSSLMVTIFAQTDRIMLKLMLGDASVGFYSAATSCVSITTFVYAAVIDSFRPRLFEYLKSSKERFNEGISTLYCVITYMCLAQCILETVFAPVIIRILYGKEYLPAVSTLQIVVWFLTFSFYGVVRNIWILAEGKQKYLWRINLLGALSNVVLNAILIPVWGCNGAAIASVITQFFTNVIVGFIIKPIRYNNTLMFRGLNAKRVIDLIKNK